MDYLWNNTDTIIPKKGDFSFIVNMTISFTLTHDYNMLNYYKLWGLLDESNYGILNNSKIIFYNRHTQESFDNNITFLKYIYIYGWVEFVIKCLNS